MAEPEENSPELETSTLESWLRPLFSDVGLGPVLIVLFATFAMFGAATLVLALRSRSLAAMAALAILIIGSIDAVSTDFRQRRFGLVSRVIFSLWALSALSAFVATRYAGF